jgi:hypothetical protein
MLLALVGCASVRVGLGLRVRLERIPLASMEVQSCGQGIAPGEKRPLVVTFQGVDGARLRTEGEGRGTVLWDDLRATTSVETVSGKGVLLLPADPRLSDGRSPHITVTVPSHPDLRVELDVPVRYDRPFMADFSGRDGNSGFNGSDGLDGTSGSYGSTDPDHPSAGGDGGDGGRGSDGQDGWHGESGPDLQIQVAFRSGLRPLLQVAISGAGRRELFLVDPQGGSLTIKADGGRGGDGGKGGRGGRGGSGGWGSPRGRNGSDGQSGRDGWSGSSGKAGTFTVTYDPQALPFLKAIHLSNSSGSGSSGPAAAFIPAAVPPLW